MNGVSGVIGVTSDPSERSVHGADVWVERESIRLVGVGGDIVNVRLQLAIGLKPSLVVEGGVINEGGDTSASI